MKKDKLAQLFIVHLLKSLPEKDYFYGENEFFITENQKLYSYDFTDIENKKIIEFNSIFFHASPLLYNMNEILSFKGKHQKAGEIWLKDFKKIKMAIENGFEVLVIWEDEYKNSSSKIVSLCKKFILS